MPIINHGFFEDIVLSVRHPVKFEIISEIVDRIVFAMEDQGAYYFVDVETAELIKDQGIHLGERFVSIPPWRPTDGFNLMERFVDTLRNPVHRDRLRIALGSRGRVFRAFKDELGRIPYIEQLWSRFKMVEMRRIVTDWYEDERRSRGLQQLGLELEDNDDLIASEFTFGHANSGDLIEVARLQVECLSDLPESRPVSDLTDPSVLVIVARGDRPGIVGFVGGVLDPRDGVCVSEIAVESEFQGLGIGRALLAHFIEEATLCSVTSIEVTLSGEKQNLVGLFSQLGFSPVAQTLRLPLVPTEVQ